MLDEHVGLPSVNAAEKMVSTHISPLYCLEYRKALSFISVHLFLSWYIIRQKGKVEVEMRIFRLDEALIFTQDKRVCNSLHTT